MDNINGYFYWKKGEDVPVSAHFGTKELTCQCSHPACIDQMISGELLNRLEKIRIDLAQPISVTSAFRCAEHQQDLRESGIMTAAGKSQHELGNASDIKCPVPIDDLVNTAAKYFQAIGIAHTWIHVDLRNDKPIRRWYYP
jgi:uncharacterized protein YcbK (DUF882 family)